MRVNVERAGGGRDAVHGAFGWGGEEGWALVHLMGFAMEMGSFTRV